MDKQQRIEEAYLTLTNERIAYERMIKKFTYYRDGGDWNNCVYLIETLVEGYGYSHLFTRSMYLALTDQLHERYKEEVYGTHVPNTTQSTFDKAQAYANKQLETQPKEEPTMSHELIENKTLINGKDITHMSDSEVFTAIADAEQVIKNLEAIKNQPQKLKDQVVKLKADIALVVKAVDAR